MIIIFKLLSYYYHTFKLLSYYYHIFKLLSYYYHMFKLLSYTTTIGQKMHDLKAEFLRISSFNTLTARASASRSRRWFASSVSLQICKRALRIRKRAPQICKRALHTTKILGFRKCTLTARSGVSRSRWWIASGFSRTKVAAVCAGLRPNVSAATCVEVCVGVMQCVLQFVAVRLRWTGP